MTMGFPARIIGVGKNMANAERLEFSAQGGLKGARFMAKSSVLVESIGPSSLVSVGALIAIAGLALGCSSSDGGEQPNNTTPSGGSGGDGSGGSGGGAGGAGGSTSKPNVTPCNINTGYPGDEYCIEAPDPSQGMQLHYGPKNYDDPAEVARYLLPPGAEKTDCVFVKTSNATEVFFNEYHGRMRPGSHHMLLYVQDTAHADSLGPEACNQGLDTRNIFGAQTLKIDVKGEAGEAPEYEGLAVKLAPNLQGVVQMHFINTGTQPILREGWANVMYTDPASVKILGDPIFFIGGIGMSVKPGQTAIIKGVATAPSPISLVAGTGHYHANTVRFSAWKVIGGVRELLMEDYDWHDPSLIHFTSTKVNPAPDPVGKTAGGYSGIVQFNAGDTIEWECEIVNKQNVTLTFGNEVYTKEMCNMFGMYAPSFGSAWRAAAR